MSFDEVSLTFVLAYLLEGIACTQAMDSESIHHTLILSRPSHWPLTFCKMFHSLLFYKLYVRACHFSALTWNFQSLEPPSPHLALAGTRTLTTCQQKPPAFPIGPLHLLRYKKNPKGLP